MNVSELAREVARLLRMEDIVFLLGAGVSLGTDEEQGIPSSRELAEIVAEEFNVPFRHDRSTLDGISSLAAKRIADVSAVKGIVARTIQDRSGDPLRAHRALARVAPQLLLTTNYDDLYERSLVARDIRYSKIVHQGQLSQAPAGVARVIKLHGDVYDHTSLILTGEDYLGWETKAAGLVTEVMATFQRSPCLFIGYSLRDPNLQRIVGLVENRLGGSARTHFALVHEVDPEDEARFGRSVRFIEGDATEFLEMLAVLIEQEAAPVINLAAEERSFEQLVRSQQFEAATEACRQLQEEYSRRAAISTAASRWKQLGTAAEESGTVRVASVAYTEAGRLYLEARDDASAESSLRKAHANARAANMPAQEQQIQPFLYQAWLSRGNYHELLRETHDVLPAPGTDASPDRVYVLYSGRADAKEAMGDDAGAIEELRAALRLIPREASYLRIRLRCSVARILATRAEWAAAREELDRGDAQLSDVSDREDSEIRRGAALMQLVRANLHNMLGEDLRAVELYAECAETFEETRDTAFLISALQGSNYCRMLIGDFDVEVAQSQLRDLTRESSEHGRIRDQERKGISALADNKLAEARSSLVQALTSAHAVHSIMSERRIRQWYADVLHTGHDFRGALQQYVLAGDRKKSSEVATLLKNSPIVERSLLEQLIADTATVASEDNILARGAAFTALTAAADMLPGDVVNDLAENLSSMDRLPAEFFADRNLLSEAGKLATSIMHLLNDAQALSVGRGIVRAILRTDCFRPTYKHLCSALSSLAVNHSGVVGELEVPFERLVELVGNDLINDSENAMAALTNLARVGHAEARRRALELARGGRSPWHIRWRRWLDDVSDEELTVTIRSILPQAIDRFQQTENGFQAGVGGLSPTFFKDWALPDEELREEVVATLADAVVDPLALIRSRQEAADMLGYKAEQFSDDGRQRAIETLMPLLTEAVNLHPVTQSIDNPLSAIRVNVGQPDDIKASAAYSLLRLSYWMTAHQRHLLMREIELLRASRIAVFGLSVSGGLRYFGPGDDEEEQRWLQTRLLLLMNAPHPEVRENAARCLGLMVEDESVELNPELIDTLLFLASSSLVADRSGAAFALSAIRNEESWYRRTEVADVLENLEADMSYIVRQAAHPADNSSERA